MVSFPEDLSLARYFLFDRLDEGLADKAALLFGARTYTYAHVATRSRQMAGLLADHGVRRGERVLIVLPDIPTFAWSLFGVLTRGAVVAMGNPLALPDSLERLVRYTRATAVVTVPNVAQRLCESTGGFDEVRAVFVAPDAATGDDPEASSGFPCHEQFVDLGPALASARQAEVTSVHRDEPAIWLFTSGSTGEPKANQHTGRDFAFNTEVYAKRTVGYRPTDVTLSVPRLFFGYATGTNLLFPFAVGATAALFSEKPSPESLAAAVARHRPTLVTNVPTMLGKLLDYDEACAREGKPLDLSSVRFSLSAGEALPAPLLRRWTERFGSDVYDGIGSAEMFHIYASNRPGDVRPGSLGRAVEGYELRVLPETADGPGAAPCAAGEIGVLWVKGDSVSQGYWLDRDKSFGTFFGHWCKTGDLFRIDQEGYLYFAGRADELLKVAGQWVAPCEVEECLLSHPKVRAAAVVGVDEEGLTKAKAFVVLRSDAEAGPEMIEELQRHARERMTKYKAPRYIVFVADLPKNDRGKVDKKALRENVAVGEPSRG